MDSVTVTVTATGYSSIKPLTYYVPPLVGKNFSFNIPMIKCNTTYDVNVRIVDGGQTRTLYGKGRITYSESMLASAKWHRGTFYSRAESLDHHLYYHGHEVSSNNIVSYLNKATIYRSEVINNINRGTTSMYTITTGTGPIPSKKYKNKFDGRFIILSNSGYEIFTFGI